jgi:hypothetical protein
MRDLVANAPRGRVPDVTKPFDERGAATDANMHATRESVLSDIRDTVTRGFRSSFLIAALFGALAAVAAALLHVTRTSLPSHDAVAVAVAIVVLVPVFIAGELRAGARSYGLHTYVDPCHAPANPFPQGKGIDGTVQTIALSAMNGAACKLGTSREEMILSLEPKSGFGPKVTWTRKNLEDALHAGLDRAINDADDRGDIPGFVAFGLKELADHAPIDWILGKVNIPFLEG